MMGALWLWLIVSIVAFVVGAVLTVVSGMLAVLRDGLDARPDDRKVLAAMVGFLLAILAALSAVLAIVFLIIAGIREATGT